MLHVADHPHAQQASMRQHEEDYKLDGTNCCDSYVKTEQPNHPRSLEVGLQFLVIDCRLE